MRESDLEMLFRKAVESRGWLIRKFKSPQHNNVPDRIIFIPYGVVALAEIKRPGEEPTPGQLREHKRYRILGIDVWTIDSLVSLTKFVHTYENRLK